MVLYKRINGINRNIAINVMHQYQLTWGEDLS